MVKTINVNSVYDRPIRIGYKGENVVTAVTFNLQMWIEEFGTGAAVLLVQRNGDANAYPVHLTIEGVRYLSNVEFALSDSDISTLDGVHPDQIGADHLILAIGQALKGGSASILNM